MSHSTKAENEAEEWKKKGDEEYRATRFSTAAEHYTRAISLRPNEPKYLQSRAAAYGVLERFDSAIADCVSALALDPGSVEAVSRGSICLAELGRSEDATDWLNQRSRGIPGANRMRNVVLAIGLRLQGNASCIQGDFHSALALYNEALARLAGADSEQLAKILTNRALAYMKLGQPSSSLEDATRALYLSPHYARAHLRRAEPLLSLGRRREALEERDWLRSAGDAAMAVGESEKAVCMYTWSCAAGDIDDGRVLSARSEALYKLGRFEEALDDATAAVALDGSVSEAHLRRAIALEGLGRHDEAGEEYGWLDRAGQFGAGAGERYNEAATLYSKGNVLLRRNRFREAIHCYEQCLPVFQALRRRQEEGMTCSGLGNAYDSLGQFRKAIEFHEKDLVIAREVGDRAGECGACGNLGIAHKSLGQYQRAIGYLEKALAIARELGDRAGEGNAYSGLGNAYQLLGQFQKAIEHHVMHLGIAREVGDRPGEGKAHGNLGNAYQSLGQYKKAIEYHEIDLVIAREVGDRPGEGAACANLGNIYHSLGQYHKAIEYHEKHLAIAREVGDRAAEGRAYGNLGCVYWSLGQYERAIGYHEKHLAIAREVGDRAGEHEAYGNLGNAYDSLGQYHKAIECYEKVLGIARDVGDRAGEGRAYGSLGAAYQAVGLFQRAIKYHEKHLVFAREVGDRAGEGMTLHNMGLALLRQGELQRSLDFLVRARDMKESLWDDLGTDETSKITLLEQLGKTYRTLQEAQVKAGHHESALETAERGRARTLVDRLSRSDATFPSEPLTASAMRSLAESCGTVVVVYSVVKEHKPQPPGTVIAGDDEYVYTWVITPDAITFDRRLPPRPLDQLADEVTTLIRPSTCLDAPTSVLTELYDLLIRPIESSLPLSDTDDPPIITFVPQGPLLFVPFAALHDSETDLDLIDRCVVSISPCVAILNRAPLLDIDDDQPRGLTVGNPYPRPLNPHPPPDARTDREKLVADLMCATAMAISVGHILGLADDNVLQSLIARQPGECDGVLVRERATKQAVLDRLRRYPRHIMIACHGHQPDETNVHLARDDHESYLLFPNDERLGEREMASLDLRATAVVDLSSCWQARGKASVEGALNLSRACIVAGAQSVVAAVTPVGELPTAFLMIRFYQNLMVSNDKWRAARALRDAQMWLRSATCGELHDDFAAKLVPAFPMRALQSEMRGWLSSDAYAEVIGIDRELKPTERLGYKAFEHAAFWAAFQVMGM